MYRSGINPEQTGCMLDVQCQIAWPGTRCDTSTSTCRCSPNPSQAPVDRRPVVTKDGIVCASASTCPLPEGTGVVNPSQLSAFLDLSNNAVTQQMCTYLSTDTSTDKDNYCDMETSIVPSIIEYVGDLYDCIPIDFDAAAPVPGVCCPSKGATFLSPSCSSKPL